VSPEVIPKHHSVGQGSPKEIPRASHNRNRRPLQILSAEIWLFSNTLSTLFRHFRLKSDSFQILCRLFSDTFSRSDSQVSPEVVPKSRSKDQGSSIGKSKVYRNLHSEYDNRGFQLRATSFRFARKELASAVYGSDLPLSPRNAKRQTFDICLICERSCLSRETVYVIIKVSWGHLVRTTPE
jgi:hypothetical protein